MPDRPAPPELRTLDDLTPDDLNANMGSERGTGFIEKSFRKFGAHRSISTDRYGRVVAGNKSLEACASIGIEKIVVVDTTGDELVVVRRLDWDLDDPLVREAAIADNRSQEVSLAWNPDVLTELQEQHEVPLGEWWVQDELLIALAAKGQMGGGPQTARPDLPEAEFKVGLGMSDLGYIESSLQMIVGRYGLSTNGEALVKMADLAAMAMDAGIDAPRDDDDLEDDPS